MNAGAQDGSSAGSIRKSWVRPYLVEEVGRARFVGELRTWRKR